MGPFSGKIVSTSAVFGDSDWGGGVLLILRFANWGCNSRNSC